MKKPQPTAVATPKADQPYLPLMLLLFVGSGCAALIYEIVWYQSLSLIVGSNAISMGVVLGTFMGGMCLGSLLLPKFVKPTEHPLRVYAKLEAGIAVCGLLILFILPYAGGLYTSVGGSGFGGLLMRGLFCAICLAIPTMLMGATLPAVARWVPTRTVLAGSVSSTAATSLAPYSVACSPVSTCCASMTTPWRRMPPSR